MIYTLEDEKLVNFVYFKYFKKYYKYKDDLLQSGRLKLISKIDSFDSSRNISIITYKTMLIKTGMIDFIRREFHLWRPKNELNTQIIDYNRPQYGEYKNIALCEIIEDTKIDLDAILNHEYLYQTCMKVLKQLNKNGLFNQIILEYLNDSNQRRIANKLNTTRQNVSRCVLIFRKAMLKQLQKEEYF